MTAPAQPGPDGPWPDLLAAYADGELDPAARDRVERWLADHPEAREQLRVQRELSPANRRLWRRAEPPAPADGAWAGVREAIDRGTQPRPVEPVRQPVRFGGWRWVIGGIGAVAAAAVLWWATAPVAPPEPAPKNEPEFADRRPLAPDDDPLAGYPVLPVAAADEVEMVRVPGDTGLLAFGRDLLPGPMVLLGAGDVSLEDVDPDDWPDGEPQMTTGPGDAPMLFGAKPR